MIVPSAGRGAANVYHAHLEGNVIRNPQLRVHEMAETGAAQSSVMVAVPWRAQPRRAAGGAPLAAAA